MCACQCAPPTASIPARHCCPLMSRPSSSNPTQAFWTSYSIVIFGGGRAVPPACSFSHTRSATLLYAAAASLSGRLCTTGAPRSEASRITECSGICTRAKGHNETGKEGEGSGWHGRCGKS